jgi:hypothetical protein
MFSLIESRYDSAFEKHKRICVAAKDLKQFATTSSQKGAH